MKNVERKFIVFTVLAILVDLFILYHSFLNATESSEWSNGFTDIFVNFLNSIFPNLIKNKAGFAGIIRKLVGHFGLFGLSGFLTCIAYINEEKLFNSKGSFIIYILLFKGIMFAGLSEIVQLNTQGRSGNITDVLIDFSGYLVGFYLVFLLNKLLHKKCSKAI